MDVEETCGTLRQYGLKLNPLKCLFGAKGGKFLGYLVTERGIEVNPKKVRALRNMQVPQNLKETQKLVGRITALSRFISRSTDRASPFFKVLRKASKFQWDKECTRAFVELKKYLEALPSLFTSVVGEPLWVYLSATPEVVGAVLVKEQDNVQRPMATNNEAEYEALLAGLQAARHVGAARVIIYSDSQLETQQVVGNFERDAQKLVNTCLSCQKHQNLTHRPTALLRASIVSCPFDQWGMNIVGPYPMAPGQKRFLLVAVDYFSKWVEAEALARITEGLSFNFYGRTFYTEVVNLEIVRGLKVKLDHVGGNWVEELPSILWAYRTTPRESTGLTPFHLVYGNEAVVPIEVGVPSVRRILNDEGNTEWRLAELDLISEIRERTAARLEAYRQRMRQNYNRKVIPRFFGEGDLVWK
ncbi:uncharacterized protein LOC122026830 [Zingiber officinale]|uniref:uncharacterized protein LOC122026830 n=1 Tax=Zingiber officinale TaxID=94328 RepID=UPI001C4B9D11|nr:uncharacterized protein LOC122026830 [Zingiber officinale]